MANDTRPWTPTTLDQRIWAEELADLVPERVFDIHVHLHRWASFRDPAKAENPLARGIGAYFPDVGWQVAEAVDAALMPGRRVDRLAFAYPYPHPHDFNAANAHVAAEVAGHTPSGGLLMVHPAMRPHEIEQEVLRHGFLGLKPYLIYATNGAPADARITDFLPEAQIAIADRHGLLIMMHLSKRDAIADPENIADLLRLSARYPRAKWVLAHCARSYSGWAIEAAASRLRGLPNIWYDTSTVCEADAIDALFHAVGPDRVMYGSDDMIGPLRGKYVTFGRAWSYLGESNHSLALGHCDARMTFIRYEMLRAIRRAAARAGLDATARRALFHDTARGLVDGVRARLPAPSQPV